MKKLIRRKGKKPGNSPGTLVHTGEVRSTPVTISIVSYDEKELLEKQAANIEECAAYKDKPGVTWINIDGIHQTDIIEEAGNIFDIHSLLLEDIVNTEHRPKAEDAGKYLFIMLKMLSYDQKKTEIKTEQVSLILGPNYLISFLEDEGDVFGPVRERLRKIHGRIRNSGTDYLAYALIDAIVDNYYIILEKLGEDIEKLEDELLLRPTRETLNNMHSLRRDMILLRKSVWPLRELISSLQRNESALIKPATGIFFRDVYDHAIQVIDTLETFRDIVSEMFDIYLSGISNRLNEIMKVLTIITTIFIPLTFIAGVYGMNFKYMAGLDWTWGFYGLLGLMALVAVIMILFIKRKKWL
jgi:magnesium transporter